MIIFSKTSRFYMIGHVSAIAMVINWTNYSVYCLPAKTLLTSKLLAIWINHSLSHNLIETNSCKIFWKICYFMKKMELYRWQLNNFHTKTLQWNEMIEMIKKYRWKPITSFLCLRMKSIRYKFISWETSFRKVDSRNISNW